MHHCVLYVLGVGIAGSYSVSCRLSADTGHWYGNNAGAHHDHAERFHYFSAGACEQSFVCQLCLLISLLSVMDFITATSLHTEDDMITDRDVSRQWFGQLNKNLRVTACLESLEVSGNLTAVRELPGNLRKCQRTNLKCQGTDQVREYWLLLTLRLVKHRCLVA